MSRLLLLALALLGAAPATPPAPPKPAPARAPADAPKELGLPPPSTVILRKKAEHGTQTQCGLCHATSGWTDVRFNHDRTGFPLTGGHTTVTCKECHVTDFVKPLPRTCVGCHTDVHAGDLGARCQECHDTVSWRSRIDVEAHRRTNFPLLGAHAAVPCLECHQEARERRFTRATVTCGSAGCHQADYQATFAPSHVAAGFDAQRCQRCHGAYRFKPARYAEHDACYVLSRGSHTSLGCAACHGPSAFINVTVGSCQSLTGNLQCLSGGCHGQAETTAQHPPARAPGFAYQVRKCYECHQNDWKGVTP